MGKKIIPYSTVLAMNGFEILKTSGKKEVITYCPRCKNDNFWVNEQKNAGHCFDCDLSLNAISFHAEVNGLKYEDALYELTHNTSCTAIEYKKFKKDEPASELAPIEKRAKTYSCFFKQLSLAPDHADNLKARGLINDSMFKTFDLSDQEQKKVINALINAHCELKGIPPFYLQGSTYRMKKLQRGILVAYLNRKGQIQGFQLRVDDDKLKPYIGKDGKEHKPSKYIWISTDNIPRDAKYGVKAETCVSYCCTFRKDANGEYYPLFPGNTVSLTEGAMKGTIAHQLSGKAFLAIPGVNSARNKLEEEIDYLIERGITCIELCFDMDMIVNTSVMKSLDKLKKLITDKNLDYRVITWNTEYADFTGVHHQFETDSDFVFTMKTLKRFIKKNRLDYVVDEVKELGRTFFFAFENKREAQDNKELFYFIKQKYSIDIKPIIWSLKLKGIDNYYAYTVKNII